MPFKLIHKKSNHNFKEIYPYVPVGTFKPMRIKDILVHYDIKFGRGKNDHGMLTHHYNL